MGVGLPGSGKTTVIFELSKLIPNSIIVSSDKVRLEITGDESDQSKNQQVWDSIHKRVNEAINEHKVVFIDATYAKHIERKRDIELYRSMNANYVIGLYINTSFSIASERNINRDRTVPLKAMQRMAQMIKTNPPSLSDGFDKIIVLNSGLS